MRWNSDTFQLTLVAVYGNEYTDLLVKSVARRAHLAASGTEEQREEQLIGALADSIVESIVNRQT